MHESVYSRKENIKVLGLIIRIQRVKLGYSLRALAERVNISHTLISNIEKGKIIANLATIDEIFLILDLQFHFSEELTNDFNKKYESIYKHLFYYEYDKAKIEIEELEKDDNVYRYSTEVVNYEIIRCLYYKLSNTYVSECILLEYYANYLEYFNDEQKQLFFFIKGLDYINQEYYRDSRLSFEKALSFGETRLSILIKEYYAITLSKANKYVDAKVIADEAITQYEIETNYIRAMRVRTRLAYDYIRIHRFKLAKDLYQKVKNFAIKYDVKDLENRCNTYLGYLAVYNKEFKLAEEYLDLVEPPFANTYYYLKMDVAVEKRNDVEFYKMHEEYTQTRAITQSRKATLFFELIKMRYDDKHMDKTKYEKNLKEIINHGFQSDDGEVIDVATMMITEFYQKDRRYKLAFEAANRLLHFLKYGS